MAAEKTSTLKVRQIRSGIGRPAKHKRILESLGLGKMHRVVELQDTPTVRGALFKIQHLISVDAE